MSKKKRKQQRRKPPAGELQEDQVQVRLKPFLGIPPGAYLTVLYGIVALFILFLLLFYKGIRDQGVYLDVSTFPPGASVRVDGRYSGSTPCEILVHKGFRRITVSKPYYEPEVLEDTFSGPIFATLIFKPRRPLNIDLQLSDPRGFVEHSLENFAANTHIPEILTETVAAARYSESSRDDLYYFLDKSKYFITNSLQVREHIYALTSIDAGVGAFTPTSLLTTVKKIIQIKQKYDNFPFLLAVVLQDESAQRIVDTDWFSAFLERYRKHLSGLRSDLSPTPSRAPNPVSPTRVKNLNFYPVPRGKLIQGASEDGFVSVQIPHPVLVEPFLVSATEVPNRLYREFVENNPDWAPENIPQLVEQDLVSESYLASWTEETPSPEWERLPVTHISFYAAQAFCLWFSSVLPAGAGDYTARLPYESEWEWAARGGLFGKDYPLGSQSTGNVFLEADSDGPSQTGSSPPNGYGLRDMSGNVWEWCLDWYSPVKYMYSSWQADANSYATGRDIPFGSEKVIRSGSWANEKELVKVHTRGSHPPQWCTPYTGFRIVLSGHSP